MADQEELVSHDAEFWLPSHFLTDEDILMDFSPSPIRSSSSSSETDCDDSLFDFTHVVLPNKMWNLPNSPQSTLCGCITKDDVSSQDSPKSVDKEGGAKTLDLLNKAAGEVARFKMSNDRITTNTPGTRAGTGFFDCSNKGQFRPLPPPPPASLQHHLPVFLPPHFPYVQQNTGMRLPHMIVGPLVKNKSNNHQNTAVLPQTPWPPAQAQHRPVQMGPKMFVGPTGPKKECGGTGVFLPRRVDTPIDNRNKSEGGGNQTKTRNAKNNNKNPSVSHQQRNVSEQSVAKSTTEIRLPSEWTY